MVKLLGVMKMLGLRKKPTAKGGMTAEDTLLFTYLVKDLERAKRNHDTQAYVDTVKLFDSFIIRMREQNKFAGEIQFCRRATYIF